MASSLSAFLGEIGRHQLLTAEQESSLGQTAGHRHPAGTLQNRRRHG
jgi:hypothetical protein